MKKITTCLLFSCLLLILQSCEQKSQESQKSQELQEAPKTQKTPSPEPPPVVKEKEYKSPLRPGENLTLGKIYTDTIQFLGINHEADEPLFIIQKNKTTPGLIDRKLLVDFIKGEELEIQWKIDSIRYAGDPEALNFTEFLVDAKKLKGLELTDKKIKFLWRVMKDEMSLIQLNDDFIKNITEPEKAALAYVATFVGNECEWDGPVGEDRENLKCKIPWALGLRYQCSHEHLDFLKSWFRNNPEVLKELAACPTIPDGANSQSTFDEIHLEVQGNQIIVFFKATGINLRAGKTWDWTEKHFFTFKDDHLILDEKEVSPRDEQRFEMGEG